MFSIGKKNWMWAIDKPTELDILKYIGHWVKVEDDDHKEIGIQIEDIKGNLTHPSKFEIIAKGKHYLISMLDFFAQMNGEKIDKETIKLFDETQFEVVNNGGLQWLRSPRVTSKNEVN